MSQYDDSGIKSYKASAAIAQYARVYLSAAETVTTAGLTDICIGTALNEAFAANDPVAVKLWSASGTHKCIADEASAVNAVLYTCASGEVQDTAEATGFQLGIALEAAGAAGDIIEVMPKPHGDTAAT